MSEQQNTVRFDNVSKAFGKTKILENASFEIDEGEALVILGRSGTGKSVTLKMMIGLLKPDQGEIFIHGKEITALNPGELSAVRKDMGFLFQNAALFDSISVGENVAFPMRRHRNFTEEEIRQRASERLAQVRLEDAYDKMPSDLSGGMKKRAAMARALALDPSLLLVDEPSAGLDPITSAEIDKLLIDLKAEAKTTLVVVTHNIPSARRIGDEIIVLDKGSIIARGSWGDLEASGNEIVQQFLHSEGGGVEMGRSKSVFVGIFVVGGFLLFAVGLFLIGDRRQLFSTSIELYAEYLEVGGLLVGAPVKVGGLGAGEVLAINVPPDPASKFTVRFRVLEKFKPILRTDSVATIQTDGIVGNKFLQVDAGTAAGAELTDGSLIQSREPFEFGDLMQQVSDTVGAVNQTVSEVKEDFEKTIQTITETTERAGTLITNVSDEVTGVAAAGNRISNDVSDIVAGVKAGEGTVGKLFTDDQLYRDLRASADDFGKTVQNIRQTSGEVQEMVTDLKSRGLVEDVDQTIENVKDITARAKKTISDFQPDEGGGLMLDMQQTLASARATMENMSENTEALKRNWLFRGYFKDRGFYDLDSISIEDYKTGIAAPGYPQKREWLHVNELFFVDPEGKEQFSDEGKKRADEAMAALLPYAKDQPIMVEGYAGEGTAADQFLRSNERAHLIRDYLVERFALKRNYVGVIPMGSVKPEISGGQPWEGVSVVLFSNKKEDRPE